VIFSTFIKILNNNYATKLYELYELYNDNNHMNRIRNPVGTKDLDPKDVSIRNYILETTKECFRCYVTQEIDTPIMELYENIKNLYGDEFHKLVYKFKDDHDELILRYDLTVPFARYVGANGLKLFRKYQIGRVYRSDDPQAHFGRYREFWQADVDIAGSDQGSGIFDFEIVSLANDLLTRLLGTKFIIRLNHRIIISQYLRALNVPTDMIAKVCTSLDKLDKKTIDEVCTELKQKDLDAKVIINIKEFINETQINKNIFQKMYEQKMITDDIYIEFNKLMQRLKSINCKVIFDPLLARGLDYYTGIIFEASYDDKKIMPGSICAGGRYDNLIEKFSNHGHCPAVGVSLGVERIITILEAEERKIESKPINIVYVASIGANALEERIKICALLRNNNIPTMMSHLENPKMGTQITELLNNKDVKYMIVIGNNEISNGTLTIKCIADKTQNEYKKNEGIAFILDKCKN